MVGAHFEQSSELIKMDSKQIYNHYKQLYLPSKGSLLYPDFNMVRCLTALTAYNEVIGK